MRFTDYHKEDELVQKFPEEPQFVRNLYAKMKAAEDAGYIISADHDARLQFHNSLNETYMTSQKKMCALTTCLLGQTKLDQVFKDLERVLDIEWEKVDAFDDGWRGCNVRVTNGSSFHVMGHLFAAMSITAAQAEDVKASVVFL